MLATALVAAAVGGGALAALPVTLRPLSEQVELQQDLHAREGAAECAGTPSLARVFGPCGRATLSNNLGVLLRIFSYYAKQTLKRLLGAGMGTASAGANAIGAVASGAGSKQHTSGMTLVIGKHEWLAFVRDCKLFSKKLVRTAEDH